MRIFFLILFCGTVGGLLVSSISSITPFGMVLISLLVLWGASKALEFIEHYYHGADSDEKE